MRSRRTGPLAFAVGLGLATAVAAQSQSTGIQRELPTAQTIASGSTAVVNFNATTVNVGGYTSSIGAVGTANSSGLHIVNGILTGRALGVSGRADVNIRVNGSVVSRTEYQLSGGFSSMPFHTLTSLNPGDTVSVELVSGPGASVALDAGPAWQHGSLTNPSPGGIGVQRSLQTGQTFAAGNTAAVNFDATTVNVGGYSAAPGAIGAAQSSGLHVINGILTGRALTGAGPVDVNVVVNGSVVSRTEYRLSSGVFSSMPFHTLANLNAGDVVSVQLVTGGGVSVALDAGAAWQHGSLTNPSPGAIGVQRSLQTGQTFAAGSTAAVNFDSTTVNVGGFSAAPGTIGAAQSAGLHTIEGILTGRALAGSGPVDLNVLVNGGVVSRTEFQLGTGVFSSMPFHTLTNLNLGDVVSLQLVTGGGLTVALDAGPAWQHGSMWFSPVPEPSSVALIAGAGIAFVALTRRRRESGNSGA